MTEQERPAGDDRAQSYRALPEGVSLEETITSADMVPVADPDAVRNVDQHRALRDD